MSDLPCRNESCSSYGRPHPNCKCNVNLADGGRVTHFCLEEKVHHPLCEYYAHEPKDPAHALTGFVANHGLAGLINLHNHNDPDKYHKSIRQGHHKISDLLSSLFEEKKIDIKDISRDRKDIKKWMDDGHLVNDLQHAMHSSQETQHFAEGGEVKKEEHKPIHNSMISEKYPAHNILLQASKGNMSDYLNTLKPQKNLPKLAFDPEADQTQQRHSYDKAVDLAADPMKIIHKIKKGTIEPQDVMHFKGLHPDLDQVFQKKLTEEITKSQLKNKKPPYHVRQGMSLFMGANLSSENSPQNVQAAQATFMTKPPDGGGTPQGSQGKKSGGGKKLSSLTKSNQAYLTSSQSLESRQQKV